MNIVLGKSEGKNVSLDVDKLLSTRLLVQANSGKGKSHLLRRIAEQFFGKVQVIIIDPEGEFATLREKYGYVLVGKGGETPADPRSAALVAHKLLELRASAVCDLYEMKPATRHEWVQKFLDAMIDAPKNLWHPCVVIVDEAHVFCPEKGAGESIASEAMIGLATRGRKRGFACIFATQRLGKLRKDAAAELTNVMIGGTFIDVDRKRAADALGFYGADLHKFFDDIKIMERGYFYALGPAISLDRTLVHVGDVETTHPEAGSAKHGAEPPPPPEAIAKLLPKLSDLPKAAEEKAKTEAELRKENRELRAQLRTQPTVAKEINVADPKTIERAVMDAQRKLEARYVQLRRVTEKLFKSLQFVARQAGNDSLAAIESMKALDIDWTKLKDDLKKVTQVSAGEIQKEKMASSSRLPATTVTHPRPDIPYENNGDLSRPQLAILKAIAEFEAIGRTQISKSWIAARAGASHRSSAFTNNCGSLKSRGYITYPVPDTASLTEKGRGAAGPVNVPTSSGEMLQSCLALLSMPQQRILRALYEAHPRAIEKSALAEAAGASATSSTFTNNLGAMKSAGMIEYPEKGAAKAADWIFVD